MQLKLPDLGTVDRSVDSSLYLVPTPVTDDNGKVLEILLDPVGGPYGSLPGDPAWFGRHLSSCSAVRHILRRHSGY